MAKQGKHAKAKKSRGAKPRGRRSRPPKWILKATPAVQASSCTEQPTPKPADTKQHVPQEESAESTKPTSGRTRAAMVSVLLGMASAIVASACIARMEPQLGGGWLSTRIILAASLFSLAAGVRLPQRFIVWVSATAWHRLVSRYRPRRDATYLLHTNETDRPLYWIVLSGVTLSAGIATGLLPFSIRLAMLFHGWLQDLFVWSEPPMMMLNLVTSFIAVFVPLSLVGLAISFAHRLSCRYGKWDTHASAWLLFGAGLGTIFCAQIIRLTHEPNLPLVAGALPSLLVAILSAMASSTSNAKQIAENTDTPLPISRDRWPRLLRASIVVAAGASAWTIASIVGASPSQHSAALTLWLVLTSMGLGVLLVCHSKIAGIRTIFGFGSCCTIAGLAVFLAAVMAEYDTSLGAIGFFFIASISLLALGVAKASGRQTLLSRVANRPSAGASILSRILVCSAATICIVEPIANQLFRRTGSLVFASVAMIVLGGTLVIHEPARLSKSVKTRGTLLIIAIIIPALFLYARYQHR